jgi:hypothetical protein
MLKHRIRKTGEIIDVICFNSEVSGRNETDKVSYITSSGEEVIDAPLNYYWDLEPLSETEIALMKYKTAPTPFNIVEIMKEASLKSLQALVSNPNVYNGQYLNQPFKSTQLVSEALKFGETYANQFVQMLQRLDKSKQTE